MGLARCMLASISLQHQAFQAEYMLQCIDRKNLNMMMIVPRRTYTIRLAFILAVWSHVAHLCIAFVPPTTHTHVVLQSRPPAGVTPEDIHRRGCALAAVAPAPSVSAKANVALVGKIAPILSKFAIDSKKLSKIGSALQKSTSTVDISLLVYVGWVSEPLVRFVYEKFIEGWRKKDFDKTYLFYVWKLASEAARIASVVYAVDCLDIILTTLGFKFAIKYQFGDFVASVLYTTWVGRKLSIAKRKYLRYQIKKSEGGNKTGRFFLYNRVFDVIITILTALSIADHLKISKTSAFSRFFTLGSVGTLVLSLAAKGVAEQFVGGLALSTTDKFFENDSILLGDGTSGKVVRIGWMSTDIRRSDETIIRIPNSQIAQQRVTNLSRTKFSQVAQKLRFKYSDIDKIPQLVQDIKQIVQKDCPKLITDGSRPYRVHWTTFKDDHIEVNVDFRFKVPLIGDAYHDNRQNVNIAIAKAMKKNDVEFAMPTSFSYEYSLNEYGHPKIETLPGDDDSN